MADYEGVTPSIAFLATYHRHVSHVQELLLLIRQDLERRALVHDRSKLSPEELPGFVRINATARQHPYGSAEYRASLEAERPTVDLHTRSNSHHPEGHDAEGLPGTPGMVAGSYGRAFHMGWLDLIEMVCDWRAAWLAYGSQGTWLENLQKQRARLVPEWLREEQWWLVDQVALWLDRERFGGP